MTNSAALKRLIELKKADIDATAAYRNCKNNAELVLRDHKPTLEEQVQMDIQTKILESAMVKASLAYKAELENNAK